MTAQSDPYVRVYYRIIDDPKFLDVYDNDAALAAWLRLLLAADAMYPAPATIPRGVKAAALDRLVKAELVDLLPGDRYRLHGLRSEREQRTDQARKAARKRWDENPPAMPEQSGSNAGASANGMHSAPLQAEPIQSAPILSTGEEMTESMKDGADAYYSVTGRFPTDRILSWINRLTGLYGDELFSKLLSKCYLEDANPRDLLGRVEERCKAIYYRQHKDEITQQSREVELQTLAEIQRIEAEQWTECANCGVIGRKHPASGDHQFTPKLRVAQ